MTINQEDICISVESLPSGEKGSAMLIITAYCDETVEPGESLGGEYVEFDSNPLSKWDEYKISNYKLAPEYIRAKEIERTIALAPSEGLNPLKSSFSFTDDGVVMLECWRGSRKVTIYSHSDRAEFVKVWGLDMENEMEIGIVQDPISLWRWLNNL